MSEEKLDLNELIAYLGLEPLLQEGGLFRQTYRSADVLEAEHLPERYQTDKPVGTAIYYLLTDEPGSFSTMHRLPTDEIYHFYLGDPVEMLLLFPDGSGRKVMLGRDVLNGQHVQYIVLRGVWQGLRLASGGSYALMGTTMAPGFTEDDFELAEREVLLEQYPNHAAMIEDLTQIRSEGHHGT